jgi:hypothetical protein
MTNEKILLVVTPSVQSGELTAAAHGLKLQDSRLRIVVPAIAKSAMSFWMSDEKSISDARSTAEQAGVELNDHAWSVEASAGDSDPAVAVEDAIKTFGPDRVLVVRRHRSNGYKASKLERITEMLNRSVEHHLVGVA